METCVGVLRTCARKKDLHAGLRAHANILRRGLLLENTSFLINTLVSMYSKCGALVKAKLLLHEVPARDVFSWTALIEGYVQYGLPNEALRCFEQTREEGLSPNPTTLTCVLKACGVVRAFDKGKEIHEMISSLGLLKDNIVLATALVDMYAKCGALSTAHGVLSDISARDVISWNALIAGYAQQGHGKEAFHCFEQMQREGLFPNAVTFTCILKACGSIGDAKKGEELHDEIARQGLLGDNLVLGTALVDMYVKCREFARAQRVLEELLTRDVICWNALIAGYAQHGLGEDALGCFEQMQHEGLLPNAVTFSCILKACGSIGAADKGKQIHIEVFRQGLLENVVLGTSLVDMYVNCGALGSARRVLEGLRVVDVVAWSALISGYAQQGQGEEALLCFEQMQDKGLSPDAVMYCSILKACGSIGAIEKGKQIHDEMGRQGLLEKDVVLVKALVDMYSKCGTPSRAQRLLEELPGGNSVLWNALISGYAKQGQFEDVLHCFELMQGKGLSPDQASFTCILRACGHVGTTDEGKQIHDVIVNKQWLPGNDVVYGTALVDMYTKCGAFAKAQELLQELPLENVASWNVLLAAHAQQGRAEEAWNCYEAMQSKGLLPDGVTFTCLLKACGSIRAADRGKQVHDEIVKRGLLGEDALLGNVLVDVYAKCGAFEEARQVLGKLAMSNVVAWNALIAGYAHHGQCKTALNCFEQMQGKGLSPDEVTFACVLKACANLGAAHRGKEVHDEIMRQGLLANNVVLGTALVDMYAKCGALTKAVQVLESLSVGSVAPWNALISGYTQRGHGEDALNCFMQMHGKGLSPDEVTFLCILRACGSTGAVDKGEQIHDDILRRGLLLDNVVLGTAVVDMYAKCGAFRKAHQVLEELSPGDAALWNALLAEHVHQEQFENALSCFDEMRSKGISPDEVTFTCVLKACGSIGAIGKGERIHDEIVGQRLSGDNVLLGTALVDMYAKCGAFAKAGRVLKDLLVRDFVSWSMLVAAHALQGQGEEALACFEQMQCQGLFPDAVTLLSVLNACSHAGLVECGHFYIVNMSKVCGIMPNLEHYACMIDLLARGGQFEKAIIMTESMPSCHPPPVWSALLSAAQKLGDVNVGRWAFDHAIEVDSNDVVACVCMVNTLAASCMQEDVRFFKPRLSKSATFLESKSTQNNKSEVCCLFNHCATWMSDSYIESALA